MMAGWLSRGSQRGESLMSRLRGSSPLKDKEVDAAAGFETFRTHWQQAWHMMQTHRDPDTIGTDEVNCVLNHADQLITLLLWDLKCAGDSPSSDADLGAGGLRILDLFLSERVLERLLEWSGHCGQYEDLLRLEQLRVYEQLLRQSTGSLLAHRAVLRPLTQLLASCRQAEPVELHRRLVLVLGHLCAALHNRPALLDLFVSLEPNGSASSFVVFSMLVDFVHRDGVIGQTAREALLQCMRLSSENAQLAQYIVQHSNFCPVLATGLSGLYSVLPRKLPVISEDRYQLLSSDSKQVPELHSFVCSLDFCNAVLQVCHPLIAEQLLDYVYQGFLVSVMGPALHQNSVDEIITATAYLDLFLRSISHSGLVRAFLRLMLAHKYDGRRIIDSLVQRIAATSKLCVVTLSLLHTLLDLNCEDVMLELVFRHLLPCTHVMVSQRPQVRHPDLYGATAHRLLALVPACCGAQTPAAAAVAPAQPAVTATEPAPVQFTLQSPISSYFEYVVDAGASVRACRQGCASWTYAYDGTNPSPTQVYKMTCQRFQLPADDTGDVPRNGDVQTAKPAASDEPSLLPASGRPSSNEYPDRAAVATMADSRPEDTCSIGESSGYQSFNPRLSPSPPPDPPAEEGRFWTLLRQTATPPASHSGETAEESCRQLGEVLSEMGLPAEDIDGDAGSTGGPSVAPSVVTSHPLEGAEDADRETPQSPTEMFGVTPNVGPFLWLLLEQLEEATTNGFQVNLQVMSVITRLSLFPQPLLRSFLLDHTIVLQPSVRSLIQTLGGLKSRIDQATAALPQCAELVQWARGRLAAREEQPVSPASSLGATAAPGAAQPAPKGGRLSLNSVASMLRRSLGGGPSVTDRPASNSLEANPDGSGFRYTRRPPSRSASSAEEAAARRLVLCAVLMEHWLQELAAIVQEHSVAAAERVLARV